MDRQDWTLLVISASGDTPLSPVQLQKSLFLIGENLPQVVGDGFYNFIPYAYGPFSSDIYSDAESLEAAGLVHINPAGYKKYSVTPAGLRSADEIKQHLSPGAAKYTQQVVDWVKRLSFTELLKSVYEKYPEYRVNSVFKG